MKAKNPEESALGLAGAALVRAAGVSADSNGLPAGVSGRAAVSKPPLPGDEPANVVCADESGRAEGPPGICS